MNTPNGFTINIAKAKRARVYEHYCRVDVGMDEEHAMEVWAAMRNRFPAPDWAVDMTKWRTTGQTVEWKP